MGMLAGMTQGTSDSETRPGGVASGFRRGVLAVVAALCLAGLPGVAIGDTDPTPTPSDVSEQNASDVPSLAGVPLGDLTISATEAAPGESVTIVGQCLYNGSLPAQTIRIYLFPREGSDPDPFTVNADAGPDGVIDLTVTIPADTVPGRYVLDATCYSDDQAFGGGFTDFTVLGEVPSPTPTTSSPTVSPSPSSTGTPSVAPTTSPSATSTAAVSPSSPTTDATDLPVTPSSVPTGDELAETGLLLPAPAVWGGTGIILLGGLLMLTARRRRLQ